MPLINSAFEPVQEATIFSKLDLRNTYHLVIIREGDEWKTALNTPLSLFRVPRDALQPDQHSCCLPALVNDVLRHLLNRTVFVYLDDILVFYHNLEEHVLHVWQVLHVP